MDNQIVALPPPELKTKDKIQTFWIKDHTVYVNISNILPEDILWRKENPRVPALVCLQEDHACTCPWNCMNKLATRCHWFFESYPKLEQILILFQRPEEKELRRKISDKIQIADTEANLKGVKESLSRKKVPRVWALHVDRTFYPRMMRTNYDGLRLTLESSVETWLDIPSTYWSV